MKLNFKSFSPLLFFSFLPEKCQLFLKIFFPSIFFSTLNSAVFFAAYCTEGRSWGTCFVLNDRGKLTGHHLPSFPTSSSSSSSSSFSSSSSSSSSSYSSSSSSSSSYSSSSSSSSSSCSCSSSSSSSFSSSSSSSSSSFSFSSSSSSFPVLKQLSPLLDPPPWEWRPQRWGAAHWIAFHWKEGEREREKEELQDKTLGRHGQERGGLAIPLYPSP